MEHKSLTDILRDRLDQYDSPMDLDLEWEALAQLKKKRRRRPFMLWFLWGLGLLIIGGSIGYWFAGFDATIAHQTDPVAVDLPAISHESPSPEPSTAVASPQLPMAKANTMKLSTEQERPTQYFKPQKSTPSPTIASAAPTTVQSSEIFIPQPEQISISPKPKLSSISPIASLPLLSLGATIPPLPSSSPVVELSVPNYSPWRIYAVAGLGQLGQRFRVRDSAFLPYQKLREQTEQSLEAYQMEIGLQYYPNQSLIFQAGVSYLQAYQRLDYDFSAPQIYELDNALLEIHRYPWGEEEIYGDTSVLGIQHNRVVHHNILRSWDLNLSLGVQLLYLRRLRVDLFGGIAWNWQTTVSGQIAGLEPNTLLDLETPSNVYRSSTGIAMTGQVHLAYHWHPRWALLLRPNISYQLGSNTNPSYPLKSSWLQYGINLGVKYRWFKTKTVNF